MLKKFVLGGMVVVAALLGNACGNDGSSDSPAGPADSEVTLSSSSDDVALGSSSSSSVTESPSTSSGQAPQSAESDGSSSSEKAVDGSSSSDGKNSSSSGKVESSSSGKGEKSSSSKGVAGSSSSEVVVGSSSSEKSSSSVTGSSSSVESSSSEEPSSSSVVESSSNVAESSSSIEDDVSSSSEYYKSSWTNLNKNITYDTIIDSRDNQVYKILTIGEQTWMAENLNYYDTIQTPELKQHSWCFNNKESNCELYGRLYDLTVTKGYDTSETPFAQLILQSKMDSNNVQGICPDRFRIPKISDYEKITDTYNKANYLISEKDNTSGFSIPVNSNTGFRNATKFVDKEVRFWTTTYHWSSFDDADVIDFKLSSYTYGIGTGPEFGHNIRCIKK